MNKNLKLKKSVLVEADGSVRDLLWNGFEALREAVGGEFEMLFETDNAVGFVNDTGGYGLTRNLWAEQIAARLGVRLPGPVYGPLMLVGPSDCDGNETHCREAVRRLAYEPTRRQEALEKVRLPLSLHEHAELEREARAELKKTLGQRRP